MDGIVEQRLVNLNIVLPKVQIPMANYLSYVKENGIVYISGQLPMQDGEAVYQGKLGDTLTVEKGEKAARLCAINLLSHLKSACCEDLDMVIRCVKLGVFINATPEFIQHPKVANGASDLLVSVFQDHGKHSRFAVGVSSLPFNVAVEVDAVFAIRDMT